MTLRVCIIGVSTFTRSLIEYLHRYSDAEIVVVDIKEERLRPVLDKVSRPIIGDATNLELLRQISVNEADAVIIALPNIETCLLCLLYLRELSAQRIIVKALSRDHVKLLELLKVDEVVFPEKQMAEFFGVHLLHPGLTGAKGLSKDRSLVGVRLPEEDGGITAAEFEEKHDVIVTFVHRAGTGDKGGDAERDEAERDFRPAPEDTLQGGDFLTVVGANDVLCRMEKHLKSPGPFGKLHPWW